jgi:hypothetical protein
LNAKGQRAPDNRFHLFKVVQDLMIPKTQHSKTTRFKPLCSKPVLLDLLPMLSPIHLDDQSGFQANEIEHIAPRGMLSAKFIASQLALTQMSPKTPFRFGHLAAQGSGILFCYCAISRHCSHGDSLPPS